jgi:hypothetical protein
MVGLNFWSQNSGGVVTVAQSGVTPHAHGKCGDAIGTLKGGLV